MGEGKLNYVIFPKGEKSIGKGVAGRLNLFFLTLGPAEDGRGLFIVVIIWLAFPLLCEKRAEKKRCGLFFGEKKDVVPMYLGLWWLSRKESACSTGDTGSIPGLGTFPAEGNGNPSP